MISLRKGTVDWEMLTVLFFVCHIFFFAGEEEERDSVIHWRAVKKNDFVNVLSCFFMHNPSEIFNNGGWFV